MSAPIMSRFDLFFILVDDCNEVKLIFNKLFFFKVGISKLYFSLPCPWIYHWPNKWREQKKEKNSLIYHYMLKTTLLHRTGWNTSWEQNLWWSFTPLLLLMLLMAIMSIPSCWPEPWGGQKLFQQMCLEVYHMKKTCMARIYWTTFILTIFLFTGNRLCHCS